MMDLNEITTIGLIQVVTTTALGYWFKNFYPAYFNQKGKNLADKEDIEDLTNKIENVKSSLDLLKSYKKQHRDEERNCLIEFYSELTNLLFVDNLKNAMSSAGADPNDQLRTSTYASLRMQTKLSKVKLLVLNNEIIQLSNQLFLQAEKINNASLTYGIRLAKLNNEMGNVNKLEDKIEIEKAVQLVHTESMNNLGVLTNGYASIEKLFIAAVKSYLLK